VTAGNAVVFSGIASLVGLSSAISGERIIGDSTGCRALLGALSERRDYNRIAERQTIDVERLLPDSPTF
jgi:hypothetical protein